ncbi:methyl-accepting chemotaxis protein [Herbaspirillum sp. YR522]|uniref:methyl-accepting chemotaxis protein n=1 Tax=Herbaspirillum sp. YR522 TaxID=1144342 RepID=UPI00026F9128|nr:methyl-accepting chemotaxis protein [Herbaspirillum sp. YR522]EJN02909.1 methyl-accepting chemotaxis protein [Herbaspirillum sp. YR522]
MHIRHLSIGARLIVGFGLVLGTLVAVVAATSLLTNQNKAQMIGELERPSEKSVLAERMKSAILTGGIAMRNIALQTEVENMQREAALVVASNKQYETALSRFRSLGADDAEGKLLAEIGNLQRETDEALKEALNDALAFNIEHAGQIIATRVDPANKRAVAVVERLLLIQQSQVRAVLDNSVQADRRLTWMLFAICGLGVAVGGSFAWAIRRSIVRPLNKAVEVATRVAHGDLSSRIVSKGGDEIGKLLDALGRMNTQLAGIVGGVRSGTQAIAVVSGEIAAGNADLSERTEAQAVSLQHTAASMSQLTEAVRHNGDNAQQANRLVLAASEVARRGGEKVGNMVQTMDQIKDSSGRIREITGVIDSIAFQTNILALNAAVEAARAGEQGRGFAVVASEVRSLAQRSAAAAREISGLISDSVQKVQAGSAMVGEAGETMNDVVAAVRNIAAVVGEIAAASDEQTRGIESINEKIALMDNMTQRNAALVEEAAASAQSMRDQAATLSDAVAVFKLGEALTMAPQDNPIVMRKIAWKHS